MKLPRRMIAPRSLVTLFASLGLAACFSPEFGRTSAATESAAAQDTGHTMGGMESMPGMHDSSGATEMMAQMHAHMLEMDSVSTDSMKAMLPMHRQLMTNMLAQINKDMGAMNMSGDAAWTAAVDSLRGDLTRMPEMSVSELQQFKTAHHARVMRVMQMHRTMMRGMKM